jgi:hypothetical protein
MTASTLPDLAALGQRQLGELEVLLQCQLDGDLAFGDGPTADAQEALRVLADVRVQQLHHPVPNHGTYMAQWQLPGRPIRGQCAGGGAAAWATVEQMRTMVGTEPGAWASVWHIDTYTYVYDSRRDWDRAAHCRTCTTPYCRDTHSHGPDRSKVRPWALPHAWDQAPEEYVLELPDSAGAATVLAQLRAAGGAATWHGPVLRFGWHALALLAGLQPWAGGRVYAEEGTTWVDLGGGLEGQYAVELATR